jgi:Asp-tRNA(Asn)/Glu-tRNA(Gln) amidotransferase A subunit family amidase
MLLWITCCCRGEGLGAEVKRRILMGTYALSAGYYDAYYKRAQQVRDDRHCPHCLNDAA